MNPQDFEPLSEKQIVWITIKTTALVFAIWGAMWWLFATFTLYMVFGVSGFFALRLGWKYVDKCVDNID